jgi:transposase
MLTTVRRTVLVFKEPVDMRKSFDGLTSLVKGQNILSGDVFLFVAKDRRRAKAMFWDGTGLNIWIKRLEQGRFADVWSRERITSSELRLFLEGSQLASRSLSPEDKTHRYEPKKRDLD